ncbi:hypothetical protein ABT214_00365 [Micromonospora purpureochromogenes]|uniref:hypothetical protein n=1 Tax=Micromonospora purpureochromogenes TaxID=47872 RepID=UPI00331C88D6
MIGSPARQSPRCRTRALPSGRIEASRYPAVYRVQAGLRCIGERTNAQLKCWGVLANNFPGRPGQFTTVVKAVQALQYLIRDSFTAAGIDTAS